MTDFRHKLIHNCITQSKASRSMGVGGRGSGGAWTSLDFEIISNKRLFLQFRGVKTKFHQFWLPPGKNFGKIPYCPPLGKNPSTSMSRSVMAATFHTYVRLLHHTQYARSRWCIVQWPPLHCNNFEFTIYLMIVGLLSTALFRYLICQHQRISKNCTNTFIFCSSWNL